MSLPLVDIRCKVSTLVDIYLEAHANARGIDKCEVLRGILEPWAEREHAVSSKARKRLESEGMIGIVGANEGSSGRSGARSLNWDK